MKGPQWLAGSPGRFEPSWQGPSIVELIYRLGGIGAMQRAGGKVSTKGSGAGKARPVFVSQLPGP